MTRFDLNFAGGLGRAILDGKKRCTTRNRVHGYPGDVFSVMGVDMVLVAIWYWPMGRIRDLLYSLEGFNSPEEFEAFWVKYKYEFREQQGRYVHIFDFASQEGFGYWPKPCDIEGEDVE